ncbi:hypothetical protein PTSG_00005 [Salpingoeca rosetta]|uniref:Glycoside hydrolase family 31 N-terminal domain-containing protein n=1 Tax=Salpingoeca rosetta (strain ATCC 50818 / BSB-021) TaxID=946362 RepID=F2TV93_SALR5|nr:uncharacterized protein PTSG_00005 [Salpingoeca rosetta]EGD71989.1 hypothetical protein PTSG_00005 [Salpingoeca rosetta]|eukprot:XP_004998561.1 hypothetical protein PTSG_00005 [Salpingoeca rosetta]
MMMMMMMMRPCCSLPSTWWLVVVVLAAACCAATPTAAAVPAAAPAEAADPSVVNVGQFVVSLDEDGVLSAVRNPAQMPNPHLAWHSTGEILEVAASKMYLHGRDGMFETKDDAVVCSSNSFKFTSLVGGSVGAIAKGLLMMGGDGCPSTQAIEATWNLNTADFDSNSLAVSVTLNDTRMCTQGQGVTSCRFTLHSGVRPMDAVYGFGVQYSVWNMKGRVVPIIVSEQGVGRGLEPLTSLLDLVSFKQGGNWHTTYGAIPYYMTSNSTSFFLNHTEYSVFDLTAADTIVSTVYANSLNFVVSAENTPLALVSEFTFFTGRMRPLPDWILQGPIIGFYGGTDAVRALHSNITSLGIMNVTGYWLQDWTGLRDTITGERLWWNWELDDQLYHGWSELVSDLAKDGTRLMTYVNPYLANTVTKHKKHFHRDLFKEAAAQGFLVKNSKGDPYIDHSASPDFTFGTVDLSNPAAVNWFSNVIQHNMIEANHSGWMSDFGEYLPFDAKLHTSDPSSFHNAFPLAWADTNRRALDAKNASDVVFFSRSSTFGSPARSTLFWLGDQLVTFDNFDGLQTVLIGRMTAGLCGHSLSHADVGGYTMVKELGVKYLRSKELLYRWMDVAAVIDVIFRSHQGNLPKDSWQVYSDTSALHCLARATRLHALFVPYRKYLMDVAHGYGYPLVRALWLQYPAEPKVADITTQVMLGEDVLFAPALNADQSHVNVTFPPDVWTHVWSGQVINATQVTTKPFKAPLGEPPIFFRSSSRWLQPFMDGLHHVQSVHCTM